jgi:hypothetical protein
MTTGPDRRFSGMSTMTKMLEDRRCATLPRPLLLAATALMALSGCTGSDIQNEPIGAAGYIAVIDDFLPAVPADGSRPVVYVAHVGDEPFALEDQVAMIEAVEETHDLRFVDDVGAAVDDEDDAAPPRDDGLLLGIGTISNTAPHVVRVEVYSAAGQVDALRLTLTRRDDVWRVDTSEPIDPEVLVGDE